MRCKATKTNGEPCTLEAQGPDGLCWAHSPKNAEARRKGASKGGRSKPSSDLAALKQKLIQLGDDVMAGRASRADAAAAATCYGTSIKCIEALVKVRELEEARLTEVALKRREQEELLQRLEDLEARLETNKGRGGSWAG